MSIVSIHVQAAYGPIETVARVFVDGIIALSVVPNDGDDALPWQVVALDTVGTKVLRGKEAFTNWEAAVMRLLELYRILRNAR